MEWLASIRHINAVLRLGPIVCWGVAVVAEYAAQKWNKRKLVLNVLAARAIALALSGDAVAYEYEQFKDPGTHVTQRFQAKDADQQIFTISGDPIPGSVELYDNSLQEDETNFTTQGRAVTVTMKLNSTDVITIKYRHKSE